MLYIHIPYCKGKCIYCDFYSAGNPDWKIYLKSIVSELLSRINEFRGDYLSSVYIGGGTPSLIPAEEFSEFFNEIKYILNSHGINLSEHTEITIEVNPEDVTAERIDAWKRGGINRVSVGVQSLNDGELSLIRRRHNADKAINAIRLLKQHFNNISVDLIYGLPGQTEDSLRETINQLLLLSPEHISAYSLTYEPNTPLFLLREKGTITEVPEDSYLRYQDIVDSMLSQAGYERYEISNYAVPGKRSRHNSGYWSGKAYLGLGPSACSYDGKSIRRNNPPDLKRYITHFGNWQPKEGQGPFYEEEILTLEEKKEERIFTSLRTADGLDLPSFKFEFGEKATEDLLRKSRRWIETGDMKLEKEALILTKTGINISDHIILDLI